MLQKMLQQLLAKIVKQSVTYNFGCRTRQPAVSSEC